MPVRDIFDKPFDEGTIVKLEIFQKYFETWLPTFVEGKINKPIQVFDLFAGSGYDNNGVPGSPIRTLEVVNEHRRILVGKKKLVSIFLNDSDESKVEQLQKNVDSRVKELSLQSLVKMKYSSLTFRECLMAEYRKELENGCNLIFIDQNGFKEVDEQVFQFLINLDTTEFMFFISSTYVQRFAEGPEVKKYHPKFDSAKIINAPRKKVHNVVSTEFEKYVPPHIDSYAVIPFSIMKDDRTNVYGLIFVTRHILGADKFLQTVWEKNAINGNANFDIEEEQRNRQGELFDANKLTKIEGFQSELRRSIMSGAVKNNSDAYYYTLNQGHISKHASDEIKRMEKEGLIAFDSRSPLVNYNKVMKERRIIEYKLVNK